MILTANFEVCIRFRSLHTSHTDFLHQWLTFPFLLLTPHVISEPPEFLVASIRHVASWLKIEGQLGSFPHQKEELWEVEKFWSNSYDVVFQQRQCNLLRDDGPVSSGILLSYSMPLPPIISILLFLPLFGLGAQGVPFLSAVKAGFPPQYVFSPTQPHKAHHQSQRGERLR